MHNRLLFLAALMLATACSDSNIGTNNSPPEVTILQPETGFTVAEGVEVTFEGRAEDRGTDADELEMRWSSSLDQLLHESLGDGEGLSAFSTAELSTGVHTITLRVIDSVGAAATDSIEVTVTANEPPSISIVSPTASGVYYLDYPVSLQATVSDLEDSPEDLRVDWRVDGTGEVLASDLVPDSSGLTTSSVALTEGVWVLVATVTDTVGKTGTASVIITVGQANSAPTCVITSPAEDSSFALGAEVLVEGTADDVDVPVDWLIVEFSSNLDGSLGTEVLTAVGEVSFPVTSLSSGTHSITMLVTDEVGATCADAVTLHVSEPPMAIITTPLAGDPLNAGDTLTLTGTVSDAEDAEDSLGVTWESDIDGLLSSPTPDSSGAVADNFTLTAGIHLLTLTATDSTGLTGTDTVSVSVNAPPTAPVVSISPVSPTSADDLTAFIDIAANDPDSGPVTPLVDHCTWTVNGVYDPAYDDLFTIAAVDTTRGEIWEVTVTAYDGQASSPGAVASVTIGNSAPEITSVSINPTSGTEATIFSCDPAGWSDADGDSPGYTFAWTVNSSPSETTQTITGVYFDSGDVLDCTVTPTDGTDPGTPVATSNTVAVDNTAPGAPSVSISPVAPTEADDLVCSISAAASDIDPNDTHSYDFEWFDDTGASAYTLAAGDVTDTLTAPFSATAAGETWTCEVTAHDGTDFGPPGSASVGPLDATCDSLPLELFGNSEYLFCHDVVTWADAQTFCQSQGMDLVQVESESENDFVEQTATSSGIYSPSLQESWLGLNDLASEGSWAWPDGSAMSYQHWNSNQPDGGSAQNCVVMIFDPSDLLGAGYWHDSACSYQRSFVCENPLPPICTAGDGTEEACPGLSCTAILDDGFSTGDDLYWIDPDGAGAIAPVELYCGMTSTPVWALVGNYIDSSQDDLPNSAPYLVDGWQQTGDGTWSSPSTLVDNSDAGGSSAAVSLEFVSALGGGVSDLRMCFIDNSGDDSDCRSSNDGSLTLTSESTGNPDLTAYSADPLAYTFGRLGGLFGSGQGYYANPADPIAYRQNCIPRTSEISPSNWGSQSYGMCEHDGLNSCPNCIGPWHGFGGGVALNPIGTSADEVRVDVGAPSSTVGFRLYILAQQS